MILWGKDVMYSNTLKQLQTLVKSFLQQMNNRIKVRYFVLDGFFGHNYALQMVKQNGLHLITVLGLEDFMNVKKTPVNNAVNLSLFMVNVSTKMVKTFRFKNTACSVLDLKARFRAMKYLEETLKILPQKPEPIVIEQITQHLGSIGAISHI